MKKILMIVLLAVLATATADPAVVIGSPFLTSSFASAALVAPGGPLVASVGPVAPVAPMAPVAPVAPVASVAALPYSTVSDYRYAYGSSLSYSDYYPVVNSALSLPYTAPYAYARDWFYRK